MKRTTNTIDFERYANKALSHYSTSLTTVLAKCDEQGYMTIEIVYGKKTKKKTLMWSDYYIFPDEEKYNKWKDWCIQMIQKENPLIGEDECLTKFKIIDMTIGLGQPYLFNRINIVENNEGKSGLTEIKITT